MFRKGHRSFLAMAASGEGAAVGMGRNEVGLGLGGNRVKVVKGGLTFGWLRFLLWVCVAFPKTSEETIKAKLHIVPRSCARVRVGARI